MRNSSPAKAIGALLLMEQDLVGSNPIASTELTGTSTIDCVVEVFLAVELRDPFMSLFRINPLANWVSQSNAARA
jgi:hypothetical protein